MWGTFTTLMLSFNSTREKFVSRKGFLPPEGSLVAMSLFLNLRTVQKKKSDVEFPDVSASLSIVTLSFVMFRRPVSTPDQAMV
jgi:hypothetical protein